MKSGLRYLFTILALFALGGPIIKNHTFFFGDYQGITSV